MDKSKDIIGNIIAIFILRYTIILKNHVRHTPYTVRKEFKFKTNLLVVEKESL